MLGTKNNNEVLRIPFLQRAYKTKVKVVVP